jgi:hypothetical protein
MGEVYRARDRQTGQLVALKLLRDTAPQRIARFEREAEILARLSHPGIVRYLTHGLAGEGHPYLVMEWLEGKELVQVIKHRALTVAETIDLGAALAAALGAAHAQGIVHRDIKPSNIFLVQGELGLPRILDFGIAHLAGDARLTQTGFVVGTLGYMAPEQARSGERVDARADVFSLGCVLFECLTGAPPFAGQHLMAVLAKILFEEAPSVRERRADTPGWLADLVEVMLAKHAGARPADGAAVAEALAKRASWRTGDAPAPPPALTGSERRLVSVLLLERARSSTASATAPAAGLELMRDVAMRHGGVIEILPDGSASISLVATGVATDLAAGAARCAHSLRERVPARAIAVATGWDDEASRLPTGEVIDRAAWLLGLEAAVRPPEAATPIVLDEVTAGLLDSRFDLAERTEGGFELRDVREVTGDWRTLLGKPTTCVGRDRELALLEQIFAACAAEPAAQPVLITAAAGVGKTRLVHELLGHVRRSSHPVEIWVGRGDALHAGSTLELLAEALLDAVGIRGGERIDVRRTRIRERVARHVPEPDGSRVAEFLGEIVDTPFPDEDSASLRAARQDPQLLGEQLQSALHDFLRAECAAHPVLLVLEDLHWGDQATVSFVDAALRELADQPFMVLASARPEVDELFPKLWGARGVQQIRLKELSPKASARLVQDPLSSSRVQAA